MPTIIATPGAADANSFATLAEANTYFDERLPLPTPWVASGEASIRALLMAARVLSALNRPHRTLRYGAPGTRLNYAYYYTNRQWTGLPATMTQRLAWPRTGVYDANGNTIASTVVPLELKEAQAELAGQLLMKDTTLDDAARVGGIKSVKAGSVEVTFKDITEAHVLPEAVRSLLLPSWLTDELIEPAMKAGFDVL